LRMAKKLTARLYHGSTAGNRPAATERLANCRRFLVFCGQYLPALPALVSLTSPLERGAPRRPRRPRRPRGGSSPAAHHGHQPLTGECRSTLQCATAASAVGGRECEI